MNKDLSKREGWRIFLLNVSAFAIIFLLLGFIILQVLNSSAYRQTDLTLTELATNRQAIEMEINRYKNDNPLWQPANQEGPQRRVPPNNRFNNQIILWSKDGQILNKEILGSRYNELQNLKLNTDALHHVQALSLATEQNGAKLTFRSITVAEKSTDSDVAFVQILANTDQINDSLQTFRTILMICMVLFWLLSIGVSYYLSRLNMKPILASWKKQQEFVENASHELRTPLTIIQNSLQRLFTKPQHTIMEESETIAQALNETRRLTGLTNDLLTIAKSDSNQLTLVKEPVDLEPFIANLVKPFQEIAEMADKQFILENYAKQTIMLDEKKLHQVLVILLDNALKYTEAKDKIILQSEISGDNTWLVEVKNTGPSISDEDKKQIFERFYREDRSRSKETGGYGLGLAIAQQIIQEHGGKITVRDLQPQGVIFQFKIPVK